jgi:hypothetical protein
LLGAGRVLCHVAGDDGGGEVEETNSTSAPASLLADGRKAGITNSGFGTVFGVVDR